MNLGKLSDGYATMGEIQEEVRWGLLVLGWGEPVPW